MTPLKQPGPSPDIALLIEKTRPQIRAFLVSLTGSASEAEDLAQETSLLLWEKRDQFEPGGNFRAWAFQIAFFQAQNHRRKLARLRKREIPDDALFEQIAASEMESESELGSQRRSALFQCLKKLSEPHRELILSRYQDERSLDHLSSEAGTNRNAMAQQLFRIKRSLLKCIQKQIGSTSPSN